jgi:hypothetical protein
VSRNTTYYVVIAARTGFNPQPFGTFTLTLNGP